MNAINLLKMEHDKVKTMLADIADESHRFATQKKRFESMAEDLLRHETMEHEIWYPYFKNKLPDTVAHLVKEEKSAEKEIKKMRQLATEEAWKNHFSEFKAQVEHHAQEEEHELFPEVEKIISLEQLHEIGASMIQFKKNYGQE